MWIISLTSLLMFPVSLDMIDATYKHFYMQGRSISCLSVYSTDYTHQSLITGLGEYCSLCEKGFIMLHFFLWLHPSDYTLTPNSAQRWHSGANNQKWLTDSFASTLPAVQFCLLTNSFTMKLCRTKAESNHVGTQLLPASNYLKWWKWKQATGWKVRIPKVLWVNLYKFSGCFSRTLTLSKLLILPMLPKRPRIRLAPCWWKRLHNVKQVLESG